jgi:hypothetical protein
MEDRSNEYVLRIESPSHGHTDYQLISTLSGFQKLSDALKESVKQTNRRCAEDFQFRPKGKLLFNASVTVAPGKIERNSISLIIDPDLAYYHRSRRWSSRIKELAFLGVAATILLLAIVGIVTLFGRLAR